MSAPAEWVAIQHVAYETPGSIATIASQAGVPLRPCHPYSGEQLPDATALGGLIVMGGPMGAGDTSEHPHLEAELALLRDAVAIGLPVLGVCLGAQLLASALGARVHRGQHEEIGFGEVQLTAAGLEDPLLGATRSPARATADGMSREQLALPVFHWHGETFELPAGAVRLASNDLYENQAFRFGECAYGLQFHVEVDRQLADGWAAHLPPHVSVEEKEQASVERCGRAALTSFFALAEAACRRQAAPL